MFLFGKELLINIKNYGLKLIFGLVATILVISSFLLILEYKFFKREAGLMLALKEDYKTHLMAVNKILTDYNKTKERLEALETVEKKNSLKTVEGSFPRGVKVFSTDDEIEVPSDSFVIINRDLEYLKQSTIDYIKKQRLSMLLKNIDFNEWQEYTDQVQAQNANAQKPRKRSRAKRVSYPIVRHEKRRPQEFANEAKDLSFVWPIDRSNFWLSSRFGPRRKPNGARGFHYGIDMAAVKGTPIRAAASGVIIEARHAPGYGKTIVIAHSRKYRTRYAHLNSIGVSVGQSVQKGEYIGKVGATGYVRSKRGNDPSHLHFEVHAFGKQVNPMYFLS